MITVVTLASMLLLACLLSLVVIRASRNRQKAQRLLEHSEFWAIVRASEDERPT